MKYELPAISFLKIFIIRILDEEMARLINSNKINIVKRLFNFAHIYNVHQTKKKKKKNRK